MLHARAASETERPWKTLKMAQIYDFPRAARAEHGHGAKKVLAGVRFQWTDPKKFLRPRWRAGGRSVPYVPRFFCRATPCSGSQHGWPSREQDVPFRFKAVQYLPHGTPGRYPAKPHDPEKRISRPGAASDSGRIGHFAGAAYAFLAKKNGKDERDF